MNKVLALKVVRDGRVVMRRYLDQEGFAKVGRDVRSALVLRDQQVSRIHFGLLADGDGFFLEDIYSTNGTQLNGRPTKYAPLRHNDVIVVGPYTAQVSIGTFSVEELRERGFQELTPGAAPAVALWENENERTLSAGS